MKKILSIFTVLFTVLTFGQNVDPFLAKNSSPTSGQWNQGSLQVDYDFVLPNTLNSFTNPDLRDYGKMMYSASDSVPRFYNGDEWRNFVLSINDSTPDEKGNINLQLDNMLSPEDGVSISGNSPTVIGLAVHLKSDFSTNTFVGLNAGLSNTYLSGTQGAQNTFIGTESGRSNTTGYAQDGVGYGALYKNTTGNGNVGLGYQALYENITNNFNTATGTDAGYRNTGDRNNYYGHHSGKGVVGSTYITGSDNMFFGWETGTLSTSGSYNSFFGNRSGFSHTTGSHNVAVGYLAGFALTTGSMNTFIGREAGQSITTQNNNVINGYRAGYNVASPGNTIVGFSAGFNTTSGQGNSFFGSGAGDDVTTGSNNTFIGLNAGNNASQSTSANFSTAIGYNSYTTKSNQMVLGHSGITETLLRGTVLVNTETDNAGGAKLQVNGKVSVSAAPTNVDDVIRKLEHDLKANKAGDTYTGVHNFTGATLNVDTPAPLDFSDKAANTEYVDLAIATALAGLPETLSGSASLDFGSTASGTSSELTITVTGAEPGDAVFLGVPSSANQSNSCYTAVVTTADTVDVRFNNYSGSPIDPGSGTFTAKIIK